MKSHTIESPNLSDRPCVMEHLEDRKLFAASLQVENLDVIPGYERMIFNKITILNKNIPNKFKEFGNLRLKNVGDANLTLSNLQVSGPFRIVSGFPSSLAPGKFADVRVQFTATAPPPFIYNQTAGENTMNKAGTWLGGIKFNTNDPRNSTYTEGLAGWYQTRTEDNQEPNLQSNVNLVMDYKTVFHSSKTVYYAQPGGRPKYYGEEVASGYWLKADPAKNVFVRQVAAWHGQGTNVSIAWFPQGTRTRSTIFTHDGRWSQSFLPPLLNSTAPAAGSFSSNSAFGFWIDGQWSDDKMNGQQQHSGGHHLRFFPVRDHFGNKLPNTYFLVMDYPFPAGGHTRPNEDFQDNIYIVSNIRPANGAVSPPVTVPPTSPPTSPPPTSPPTSPPPTSPPTSPPPPTTTGTPKVSFASTVVSTVEGNSGLKAVTLTLKIDRPITKDVTFYYTTANGNAQRDSDYNGASGKFAFYVGGDTSKTITVYVRGDTTREINEYFNVNLYGITNGAFGNTSAQITIGNDD